MHFLGSDDRKSSIWSLDREMAPSFPEIINSRLFKFIVGETIDGSTTEFQVYEEAIAQLSKPLYALIKGNLSEAQAGCTIWKEVSKETFERFVQFAYTGDYSIPDTREWIKVASYRRMIQRAKRARRIRKERGRAGARAKAQSMANINTSYPDKSRHISGFPVTVAVLDRLSLFTVSLDCAARNIHHDACEPAGHFEPNRSYCNVFLSHASLYALGDFWLIDVLKALAIYKLHKALCIFQLNDQNVTDIVDLARYAYQEEGKGLEDGIGRLRGMVCQYMALHATELSLLPVFMDFIEDGGQFARDFVKFAVQRMQ